MGAAKTAQAMNKNFGVHPDVLKLGLVSFLTDVSSEMILSVFAIFFTTVVGASSALLGLVEGFADFSVADSVAGWLSDKTGKRKAFALARYGFSTTAKIILLLTGSVVALSFFRVVERLEQKFPQPAAGCMAIGDSPRRKSAAIHSVYTRHSIKVELFSVPSSQIVCFRGWERLHAALIAGALWALHQHRSSSSWLRCSRLRQSVYLCSSTVWRLQSPTSRFVSAAA